MIVEVGSRLEGKVSGITNFGAFIQLPDGTTGLVHISEIAEEYVKDIKNHLCENQIVTVVVISIDNNGKISLSIKKAKDAESIVKIIPKTNNFKKPRKPADFEHLKNDPRNKVSFEDRL